MIPHMGKSYPAATSLGEHVRPALQCLNVKRLILLIAAAVGLAVTTPALALDFKMVNAGAQASLMTPPYPALIGLSAQATFFDLLRVQGDFGAGQFVLGRLVGVKTASWGASALLRVPSLPISPIVGIGLSKNYNDERSSVFHSKGTLPISRAQYLTPMAGVEFRTGLFYFGFGLCAPFRKVNGKWQRQGYDAENSITGSMTRFIVLPFGYLGLQLF